MTDLPSFTQPERNTSRTRRYVLGTILFLVLALTATQIWLHQPGIGSPKFATRTFQLWTATVLVILALLILATILGRNLIKLYFERKSGQVGSVFKTKMVRIFVVLALLPAVLLFSMAYWMLSASIEQWFSAPAVQLQESSQRIAKRYYEEAALNAKTFAADIAARVGQFGGAGQPPSPEQEQAFAQLRQLFRIDVIRIYGQGGTLVTESGAPARAGGHEPDLTRLVMRALQGTSDYEVQGDDKRETTWATAAIRDPGGSITGAVVTETSSAENIHLKAIQVMQAYDAYEQLQREKRTVRFNILLILALSTLLIVFAFSWFAMYLAKRITVPIQALAEGAAAVAAGNLDYRVKCVAFDELGSLVTTFNRMTSELQENKANIEEAQNSLRQTNVALDERRRYIETVLQAIATGVVSLDADYRIRTMNRAAMEMLEVEGQAGDLLLEEVVKGPAYETLRTLMRKAGVLGPVIRNIELNLPSKSLHLATTVTSLVDGSEQHTGWVVVLDDLTELLRAEKMAAWQEVARRLAHEIKNPLTPIQLSAERMLSRYRQIPLPGPSMTQWRARHDQLAAFDQLLEECVQTIIREADSLKNLVDEFSSFARLPGVRLEETDLHRILESALSLYNGRIQDVLIERSFDVDLPPVSLDAEQMKRVFINLIDNALEAMSGEARPKVLRIRTSRNVQQRSARIEISDTGRGFPKEYQDSLFLPYFSRRQGGTGLGLAIVRQVVSDHHGQVRAEPNLPVGTRIVIDLPLAAS